MLKVCNYITNNQTKMDPKIYRVEMSFKGCNKRLVADTRGAPAMNQHNIRNDIGNCN
jgi:hypothetical protein